MQGKEGCAQYKDTLLLVHGLRGQRRDRESDGSRCDPGGQRGASAATAVRLGGCFVEPPAAS